MENENFYAIRKEGIYRGNISWQHICMSTDMIKDMIPKLSTTVPLVVAGVDQHGPLSMMINKEYVSLYGRLNYLVIDTWWDVDSEGILTPNFSKRGNRLSFKWTTPTSMTLAFMCQYTLADNAFYAPYLVALNKDGQFHRLPFSNIYDNGGVCLISGGYVPKDKTLQGKYEEVLTVMNTNPWAGDLLKNTDIANAAKLVRFTADGKVLPPTARDWTKCCFLVSNEYTNPINLNLLLQ